MPCNGRDFVWCVYEGLWRTLKCDKSCGSFFCCCTFLSLHLQKKTNTWALACRLSQFCTGTRRLEQGQQLAGSCNPDCLYFMVVRWKVVESGWNLLRGTFDKVTPGCIPGLAAACCRHCPSESLRRLFKAATGVVKSKVLQFPRSAPSSASAPATGVIIRAGAFTRNSASASVCPR